MAGFSGDLDHGLDLSLFLALVSLTIAPIPADCFTGVTHVLMALNSLESIQFLTLVLHGFDGAFWPTHLEGPLASFDAALNTLSLPALRCVSVRLCNTTAESKDAWCPCPSSAAKRELVAELLPGLNARGVLVVTSC